MEKKKMLPIGIESFEKLRSMDCYYVDKTGLIKDLLENFSEVTLFTRPDRFGKSLNINILQSFFEIGTDPKLFDGLEISKEQKLCDEYLGKYPVISINLKDVAGTDFEEAQSSLATVIRSEAMRHQYLLESSRLLKFDKSGKQISSYSYRIGTGG